MVCSSVQLVFLLICTSFISGHYTCLIENRRGWQVRVMGRVGGEVAWWNQSMRLLPSSLTLTGQRRVWSADIGAHIFTSFYAKPDVHHSEVRTQNWQLTNIKKMSMVSPTINWNKKSKFFCFITRVFVEVQANSCVLWCIDATYQAALWALVEPLHFLQMILSVTNSSKHVLMSWPYFVGLIYLFFPLKLCSMYCLRCRARVHDSYHCSGYSEKPWHYFIQHSLELLVSSICAVLYAVLTSQDRAWHKENKEQGWWWENGG